jgi:PAS domain S-box-containing protein
MQKSRTRRPPDGAAADLAPAAADGDLDELGWRALANSLPAMVGIWSPGGVPLFFNDRWFEYTGLPRGSLTAGDVRDVFHPQEAPALEAMWRESLRGGEAFAVEARARRRDGVYRWHLGHAAPIRDATGAIKAWISSIIDIDPRKQAEEALRKSERRFRQLADAMPQIVWTARPDGVIDYANERLSEIFGPIEPHRVAEVWRAVIHPDEETRAVEAWGAAVAAGTPYEVENRYRHPADGRYRWYLTRALPVRDDDGRIVRWFGTSTDIDDRKRVEQALRVSEERFRQLADAMPQIVWTARPDGVVDYFNRRWYEFVGHREVDRGTSDWLAAVHPEDGQASLDAWNNSLETGSPLQTKERLREGATGRYRWHLSRALPVRDESGEIVRWFGTSTDIEELVRAEQALTEESRVVESLQAIGATLTAELDLHRVVQRVIESATRLTGAAFGVFFYNLVGEDGETVTRYALAGADEATFRDMSLPRETRLFAPSLSGNQTRISNDVTHDPEFGKNPPFYGWPSGHPAMRSYLSAPVTSRSGEGLGALFFGHPEAGKFGGREERIAAGIAGWAAVAVDNARLFAASERQTEELKKANAAKDEFLGLVSHELKTPITTIFGNAEVLRRRFEKLDEESRTAALSDISNEAERLHRIIDNLLVLARLERGQAIHAEPLLLRRLVEPIVAEHRRRFPHRVIHVAAPRGTVPISGEPVYVEQVIRNLLSNAEKYSSPHTPIEVRIERVANSMAISVLDRGRGFSQEEAELIFTPFYRSPRTADVAGGVGVGLAVCKRLIEAQGGSIWARPREDGGAEIGFSLPLAD